MGILINNNQTSQSYTGTFYSYHKKKTDARCCIYLSFVPNYNFPVRGENSVSKGSVEDSTLQFCLRQLLVT